ncbi:DUF6232 family protein [Dactylosporangium sp. NBC_01737]|uniref:DUF6232 family protein n=1 Tax=Dactylosporangium sp. NBC_01737 TaxID=2975959 RepID=UPI002E130E69|nr:DUF6232 family protein [Dactylosporangium sp. NBC_01737]
MLLAVALLPLEGAIFSYVRCGPRQHVLSAEYQGRRVTLSVTRDAAEFGRISRALMRALESGRDGPSAGFGTATADRSPTPFQSATPTTSPVGATGPPTRPAEAPTERQDAPATADARPQDAPSIDSLAVDEASVPPGLIDEAFARYDDLLLRVGPPPGWQANEGRDR